MKKQDFSFHLPPYLIADKPVSERSASRLLVLDPQLQKTVHTRFSRLLDYLSPEDCLIFNNTKVIPARLYGQRDSGGKVEILLERVLAQTQPEACLAQVRASNRLRAGTIIFVQGHSLRVDGREGEFYRLHNESTLTLAELFEKYGEMPLPPYISRRASDLDKERYQTVYAQEKGAVAAPTAGLHFDEALLAAIKAQGIAMGFVTLHVGAGTFAPVRVDHVSEHKMHKEVYQVPHSVVDLVKNTRQAGGRVIAVGTTSVRCLESAAQNGQLEAGRGETDIFIYPGYEFKAVDALITNFHLSESTLLMLVSAFAGRSNILAAYQEAIEQQYRFFSYGDAMFIQNRVPAQNSME